MSVQKVLITGISGFTGPYVQRALEADGHEVYGLVNNLDAATDKNYYADLLDLTALVHVIEKLRPTVLIHLAAVSFVGHGDIGEIYNSNVVGTRNLLEAVAESDVELTSIILASSANVYGNVVTESIDEEAAFSPVNDYAVSKASMELMAGTWKERLPVTIVRPFNYTGVGQSERFLIPKIVSHFVERKPRIELGNIDVYRDFSDVRVVAAAYTGLVRNEGAGGVYNICSGKACSLSDILDFMAEIAGYRIEVDINPAFVRSNEVVRLIGCSRKLQSIVPEATPINIKETLRWMYQAGVDALD